MIPIERTGEYRGVYHVLGGALSPIDGIDPEDLRIAELLERVNGEVSEVVLATNPTTTGEATALHIAEAWRGTASRSPGSPAACRSGADLEHADEVTLGKALAGRRSARLSELALEAAGRVVVAAALRVLVAFFESPGRTSS